MIAPGVEIRVARNQQGTNVFLHERGEGGVQLFILTGFRDDERLPDAACRLLKLLQLTRCRGKEWIK
jgi:hypothetical protein